MLARLSLLAASAAVLVSAQVNAPRPGPILGCTTNSFAVPSWFIQDLEYSGAAASSKSGNVSFHLVNRANNYTADMACQVGSSGWNACSIQGKPWSNETIRASVQVDGTSAQVLVNQTWTCSDRNKSHPLTFEAVGNSSVALNCTSNDGQGQACSAVNSPLLVKGSLLSPVAVTPAYAEGPTGHSASGCSVQAQNPYWTLSTIYYSDQPGDGVTTIPSRSFNLQIINPSIGYQASCMAGALRGDANQTLTSTRLTCAGQEFGALGAGRYHLETEATYDPATSRFSVNQTWYCDDIDAASPLKITAMGSEILPLDCTSAPADGGNQTTCVNSADVTLNGELLSKVPLAPYSIEEPVPTTDGCTASSILNPRWIFSHFELDRNESTAGANDSSPSTVSFNVILQVPNPGFQYPVSITQDAPVANSNSWYACAIGGGGNTGGPLWPYECSFQYNPATNELALKANWACSDLDPDHPVSFSGVTTTTVNSPLTCDTVDGISQCLTTDTGYSWTADISNVTWRAAPPQAAHPS